MPKLLFLLAIVGIIAYGGYYFMNNQQPAMQENVMVEETMESPEASGNVITLSEQNASGEVGTATLTESDGKTMVKIEMKGSPMDTPQPAHIHIGSCPDVGAVAYPLTNLVNGMSETTLDVTLSELAAKQPLGINVHKSAAEAKVYTACGDLKLTGSSTPTVEDKSVSY